VIGSYGSSFLILCFDYIDASPTSKPRAATEQDSYSVIPYNTVPLAAGCYRSAIWDTLNELAAFFEEQT
jgi:hypothetical protein